MKCLRCKKSDAVRSVSFILSDGTIETNSQTEVEGIANTAFNAVVNGIETFRGDRTGYEYSGTLDGNASTQSFEVHETNSVTQTKLASRLANIFGPYLSEPTLLLTPQASAELESENAKKSRNYKLAGGIFGGLVVLELISSGMILWSVFLGAPAALIFVAGTWFMGLGTDVSAVEKSSNSPLNLKRFAAIEQFNTELANMYAWLDTTVYCSRCNVVSDDEEYFEFSDLSSARPQEPVLPNS